MKRLLLILSLIVLATPLYAGDSAKADVPIYQEPVTTKHSVTIDGKRIEYEATAGHLTLTKEDGTVLQQRVAAPGRSWTAPRAHER